MDTQQRVPPIPVSALASSVQRQMEASQDTVRRSERILQNTEALLSADTPRDESEEEVNESVLQTPFIPQPTPQQTAEHSYSVHNDITYAKHYLAQTQERLQHTNKQDPIELEDPLNESIFNPKDFYNNENIADGDGLFLAVESVGRTTGVLSKSVQEQIKASKSMMKKSEAMMDSLLRIKSTPALPNGRSSPTLSHPANFRNTPSPQPSTPPPTRSPIPPIYDDSDSDEGDDFAHLKKIYHGKNSHPPSASLDKILSYSHNSPSPSPSPTPTPTFSYGKPAPAPPVSSTSLPYESNSFSNPNFDNRTTTPPPHSPASRPSSSLSKPQLSIPPLIFPTSSSPSMRLSFTPTVGPSRTSPSTNYTKPMATDINVNTNITNNINTLRRPVSPYLPPTASISLPPPPILPSPSTPASAARSLLLPPNSSSSYTRAPSPSLPVAELSRLDISNQPPKPPTTNLYTTNPSKFQTSTPKPYTTTPNPYSSPSSSRTYPPTTSPTSTRTTYSTPSSSLNYSSSLSYPSSSSFTPSATTPKSRPSSTSPTPNYTNNNNNSNSNNITAAMVTSLTTKEREEYVERIKNRNKSANMHGDSILDRFFSPDRYGP